MVSGAERKALSEPLTARTTAFPVPAQLFSADWMREVSGGEDSWALVNVRELGATSVALSVVQVPGRVGSVTVRWSPMLLAAAVAWRWRGGDLRAQVTHERRQRSGVLRRRVREERMTAIRIDIDSRGGFRHAGLTPSYRAGVSCSRGR